MNNKMFTYRTHTIGLSLLILSTTVLTGCMSIHTAARQGNLKEVGRQMAWGVNADKRNFFTRDTLLIEAAANGHLDVVKLIIENGADVNLKGEAWYGPLHAAAAKGHIEVVKILLENGADVKIFHQNKPLNYAAMNGHIEVAEILLAHGADINAKGTDEAAPLHTAVSNNQLAMVKWLLSKGANVNPIAAYGCTPLHSAARSNNVEIGKILLEHGADPTLECNGRRVSDEFLKAIQQRSQ
ncbi:MAG: ankyrin repeat domain-containing protein [Phycisphaerae bacterium]|nr:ankyrin repeat domain-containing protein [Phycisphaerae bacterium]